MLSYICQLAFRYENSHDIRPNTLYLNHQHYRRLSAEFVDTADINCITNYLGMVIVLTREITQPYLAYHGQPMHDQGNRHWQYNRDALQHS